MSDESLPEDRGMTRRAAMLAAGAAGWAAVCAEPAGAADMVPMTKRLEVYGLHQRLKETDLRVLTVESGKTLVLSRVTAEKLGAHVNKLVPQTLHDVKRWIGIPDVAIPKGRGPARVVPPSFMPMPMAELDKHTAVPVKPTAEPGKHTTDFVKPAADVPKTVELTRAQAEAMRRMAVMRAQHVEFAKHALPYYNFVFHDSTAVSLEAIRLISANYLKYIAIWGLYFSDIHVASGAQLVISQSVDVLFARHIQIDTGAKVRVQGNYAKIDCASLRGGPKDKALGPPK